MWMGGGWSEAKVGLILIVQHSYIYPQIDSPSKKKKKFPQKILKISKISKICIDDFIDIVAELWSIVILAKKNYLGGAGGLVSPLH